MDGRKPWEKILSGDDEPTDEQLGEAIVFLLQVRGPMKARDMQSFIPEDEEKIQSLCDIMAIHERVDVVRHDEVMTLYDAK